MPPPGRIEVFRRSAIPACDFGPLLAESRAEGYRFLARLRDEWESGANRFDRGGEALYVARRGGVWVGICGLNRDPFSGDADVGRLRHLYVSEGQRRVGVGRALVEQAVVDAQRHFRRLVLRTNAPAAAAFYAALGFSPAACGSATHALELRGER